MKRIAINSSACALFVLLGAITPVSVIAQRAQGARSRGAATAGQERAVPRGGGGSGQATQAGTLAPEPQARVQHAAPTVASPAPQRAAQPPRVEPSRRQPPLTGVPPLGRLDSNSVAVPRPLPRVIPGTIGPIVPSNVRPNNRVDYRPNYRPGYQPYYRPQYSPNYRPYYPPAYRPYYRPYYTFRPHVQLGFGLWIGYPVRYPSYYYPVTPYPYAYPSASQSTYPTVIYPAPSATVGLAGGLSFEITPAEAGVYIDGDYLGTVSQFSPDQPPLALTPGRHHVEIRYPGFEIIAFDVDILPGQVIPYQGELRPT